MSVTALGRAVRASPGVTPMGLVARRRADRAKAMVEAGGLSPAPIAAARGHADQAHLTRRFRAAFGRTPGAHRRARRAGAQ